jgi:hypothetical protein
MFISVTEQYMGTIEIKAEMCIIILYMMVVQDPIRETAEAQWLGSFSHFQLSAYHRKKGDRFKINLNDQQVELSVRKF